MDDFRIHVGDSPTVMSVFPVDLFDACVTDPPYELGFMGKKWDGSGVAFNSETWRAVYRVLKPGARLLAFGGSRTHHRIWAAIEDAGFVIEDTIMWLYGSGFPKHKSKLKPAVEPVCVARKGPVSDLNIDAARIGVGGALESSLGRWPANIVLDEEAAAMLDAQSGESKSPSPYVFKGNPSGGYGGRDIGQGIGHEREFGDRGGASRFFYIAKADRAERDHGLEGATKRNGGSNAKGFRDDVAKGQDRNRPVANHHPTVKPVDLMRWLVRLVTQPGDLVLDPFTGSGTTGVACMQEGRNFCGIELSMEYAEIARRRIGSAPLSLFGG